MTARKKRWILGLVTLLALPGLAWGLGIVDLWATQMAWRAMEVRDYGRALSWARLSIRRDSADSEVEFLQARIARKQSRLDEFLEHLKRAEVLGFDRRRIRREIILVEAQRGQITQTLDELPQLLIEQEDDGAEICEAFANGLLTNGLENEARTLLEKWAADFPSDPQPDVLRGRLAEFRTQTKEAEQHYRTALQKSKNSPTALFGLARTLRELNRFDEALDLYRRGLHPPFSGAAQFGIARCLRQLGREDEAYQALRQAAAIPAADYFESLRVLGEPTEDDALATELGTLEANRQNFAEAVRWLQRAVDRNPHHREARYQLAKTLQSLGKADQAQPHFDFLASLEPRLREIDALSDQINKHGDDLEARFRMGVLQLEVGSKETGLYWLRSVVARDPKHSQARALIDKHTAEPLLGDKNLNEPQAQQQRRSP